MPKTFEEGAGASGLGARFLHKPVFLGILKGVGILSGVALLAALGRESPARPSDKSVALRPDLDAAAAAMPSTDAGADWMIHSTPVPVPTIAEHKAARASPDDPIVLNDATLDDFRRLPGIGPKRAQAMLELRTRLGKFHRLEELLRVRGIGRKKFAQLKPLVRLDRPAPAMTPSADAATR